MAWVDDRAWCHPKLVGLSDRAFRVWVNGISYSAGMGTRGVLSAAQQKLLGSSKKVAEELIKAGVWHTVGEQGAIGIKDWDEHNGKRDERRAADRERKRKSRGQSAGTSPGQSAGPAHVDRVTSDRVTTTTEGHAAIERLKKAGWSTSQINAAVLELARAVAWLNHAEADPSCQSPGALSWSMFKKGGSPDVAATVANGAQGTRSTSKAVTYTCEECEAVFDTYLAREEHVDSTHFEPAAPPTQRLSA